MALLGGSAHPPTPTDEGGEINRRQRRRQQRLIEEEEEEEDPFLALLKQKRSQNQKDPTLRQRLPPHPAATRCKEDKKGLNDLAELIDSVERDILRMEKMEEKRNDADMKEMDLLLMPLREEDLFSLPGYKARGKTDKETSKPQ